MIPEIIPSSAPTYNVTFFAPTLNGSLTLYFYLDSILYSGPASSGIQASGLPAGVHTISGATASPHLPGWQYFGTPSSGSEFALPGVSQINFTFAYENMSAPTTQFTFTENQLPVGNVWDLTFNGTTRSSSGTSIVVTGHPGWYEAIAQSATGPNGTVQFVPNTLASPANYSANASFKVQFSVLFLLQVYGGTGGSVLPDGAEWEPLGTVEPLFALGSSAYVFKSWTGTGLGSYTGEAPQHSIILDGPITEFATFLPRPPNDLSLRLTELGLPNGTIWTAYVGGLGYSSGRPALVVPNLYSCINPPAGQTGNYSIVVPDVYINLTSPGLSSRYLPVAVPGYLCGNSRAYVNFTVQYLVLAQATAGGAIAATDPSGSILNEYAPPGTAVTFTASTSPGYTFEGWHGIGNGSYNGAASSVTIPLYGSVQEVASFSPNIPASEVVYALTFVVPAGEMVAPSWGVTVDGTTYAASGSTLTTPPLSSGPHQVKIPVATSPDGLRRSTPLISTLSVSLGNGPQSVNLTFSVAFWVTIDPIGPGVVAPGSGWFNATNLVREVATPGTNSVLVGWFGDGDGAYNGTSTSAELNVSGPITEFVTFGSPAPPADFWHRTIDVAAVAVIGLLVGALGLWFLMRYRRRAPPRAPDAAAAAPPSGTSPVPTTLSGKPEPWHESNVENSSLSALLIVTLLLLGAIGGALGPRATAGSWVGSPSPSGAGLAPASGSIPSVEAAPASSVGPVVHPIATGAPRAQRGDPVAGPNAGVNLAFHEIGLPNGTLWSVSWWKFQAGVPTPATASASGANITANVTGLGHAIDFAIWTLPTGTTGTVWSGTPSVPAPVDPASSPNVSVSFTQSSLASLNFRFHVATVGLPSGTQWNATFDGTGYAFSSATTDWAVDGGKAVSLAATPVYATISSADVNISTLLFPPAYFPTSFDFDLFEAGSSWINASAGPITQVAAGPAWVLLNFSEAFHVHVFDDSGGTVSPGSGWFTANTSAKLTATPQSGYAFAGWTGNGSGAVNSSNPVISIVPRGTLTEDATFIAVYNNVTLSETGIPAGQSYYIVFNGGIYSANTSTFALPAVSAGGYNVSVPYTLDNGTPGERFVPSSLTATFPPAPDATFEIGGPGVIYVNFLTQYSLTVAVEGAGTSSPGNGSYWEPAGSVVAIAGSATSNAAVLQAWSGSGPGSYSGANLAILVTMGGVLTETAHFGVPLPATTATLTATESGLPSGSAWSATLGARGASTNSSTLTIPSLPLGSIMLSVPAVLVSPSTRYVPQGVGVYSLGLAGDTSFAVSFREQFALEVHVEFGGSVASYPTWVDSNGTVTLLAEAPSAGFVFLGWSGSVNATTAMITLNATEPLEVIAEFSPAPNSDTSGPKDAAIAAAAIGIPLLVGALATYLWLRQRPRA
ncbi:MAG: InlB B-repeat-containing protein [Thermoplasmata archaeon]|nr:InlB B-repeat-containing protein [Thermoplasmata archaeon]